MNCLFCKIIKGEVPTAKVYEDENSFAFLDINPVNKGHCLVLPKKHIKTFLDIPKESFNDLMSTCQKVAEAMLKTTNTNAFNIIQNNNEIAGQGVEHVHFHIIPRFEDDGIEHWKQGSYNSEEERKEWAEKIKKFL